MRYQASRHAARHTEDFVFSQLIPYIGNKRKLRFDGSSSLRQAARFQVSANDWEPYAEALAQCAVNLNQPPTFFGATPHARVLEELNSLPPREG